VAAESGTADDAEELREIVEGEEGGGRLRPAVVGRSAGEEAVLVGAGPAELAELAVLGRKREAGSGDLANADATELAELGRKRGADSGDLLPCPSTAELGRCRSFWGCCLGKVPGGVQHKGMAPSRM